MTVHTSPETCHRADDPAFRTVDVAVILFGRHGFAPTTLDAVAAKARTTKRAITYQFGDKRGLYRAALSRATHLLSPEKSELEGSFVVPAEGMHSVIMVICERYLNNPDATQLLLRENIDPVLSPAEYPTLREDTDLALHLNRLLIRGQDSGAFRPGISADDVLMITRSLLAYRVSTHLTATAVWGVDLATPENTRGLTRLAVDTVLSLLTGNIPDNGEASYLLPRELSDSHGDGIYGADDRGADTADMPSTEPGTTDQHEEDSEQTADSELGPKHGLWPDNGPRKNDNSVLDGEISILPHSATDLY